MESRDGAERVRVREVGRDGLQMARSVMSVAAKLRWVGAMARVGVREMEVASFVPPVVLPQFLRPGLDRQRRYGRPHLPPGTEGFDTGIDLAAPIAARAGRQARLPGEALSGRVAAVGSPRTCRPAQAAL